MTRSDQTVFAEKDADDRFTRDLGDIVEHQVDVPGHERHVLGGVAISDLRKNVPVLDRRDGLEVVPLQRDHAQETDSGVDIPKQAKRFGTIVHTELVSKVDFSKRPFVVSSDDREVHAESVIISTGASVSGVFAPK